MTRDKVSTLLLFGATGDLAHRMLLPSLYGLHADGLLPDDFRIVCTARSELDDEQYRAERGRGARRNMCRPDSTIPKSVERLLPPADLCRTRRDQAGGFQAARRRRSIPSAGLAIFLSTAPSLFKPTIDGLAGRRPDWARVRLALEKPLGTDLAIQPRDQRRRRRSLFPRSGRSASTIIWARKPSRTCWLCASPIRCSSRCGTAAHIDHVQITVAETVGLEGRGDYYDGAGALRDMVQNHMLQLLALVAMEPPADFDATAVRDEKVKVLRSLRPIAADDIDTMRHRPVWRRRGRWRAGAGLCRGTGPRESATETFVALKAHVDNWRWAGVPFYLRTGKRMPKRHDRNLHPVQMRPALDLRRARRRDPAQQAGHRHPAGREYPAADDGQDAGPRPRRHSVARSAA